MKQRILQIVSGITIFTILGTQVIFAEGQENTEAENPETNHPIETTQDLVDQKEEVTQQIEEKNVQLEYVQDEISSSVLEIQKLSDSITQYEKNAQELQSQLATLQQELTETTQNYDTLLAEYEEKQTLLNERLVTLYKAGDTTYLEVLLSAKNLSDFLSRYFMIERLAEYDGKLIQKLEQEKNNVEIVKNKLEARKAEAKITKAKAEQASVVLQNTRAVIQDKINSLSAEEQAIQSEIETYKQQQLEIEARIQQAIWESQDFQLQFMGGKMIWPIAKSGTYITSPYGSREHPIQGVVKLHSGIDIGNAGFGAPVVAAADGIVIFAGENGGYGNCVMINHGDGIVTLYGHGQRILTQVGSEVKQGDLIMEVGSTGVSTGPHLHFEIRVNGNTVNPLTYLRAEDNTIE